MPDGPPATLLRAERRFLPNLLVQFKKGKRSVLQDLTWEWLLGGRRCLSCNWSNVDLVPGANSLPSKPCRAEESSPTCTNLSALMTRRSTSSPLLRRRCRILPLAACSLAVRSWIHSPREKASRRATNFDLGINPPPGGRWRSILGNSMKSFFPPPFLPLFISHVAFQCQFQGISARPANNMRYLLHHRCSLAKHCTRVDIIQCDQRHPQSDVPSWGGRDSHRVRRTCD